MENKNKSLTEQLKEHIDKIGEEAFEREIFEFNCEWHGVDPNAKNAKKKLKRIMWWEHFKYKTLPKIEAGCDLFALFMWGFTLGWSIEVNSLGWIAISSCFSVFLLWKVWNRIFDNLI